MESSWDRGCQGPVPLPEGPVGLKAHPVVNLPVPGGRAGVDIAELPESHDTGRVSLRDMELP